MSQDSIYIEPTVRSATTNIIQRTQDQPKRSFDEEVTLEGSLHGDRSNDEPVEADGSTGQARQVGQQCVRPCPSPAWMTVWVHAMTSPDLAQERQCMGRACDCHRGPRWIVVHGDPQGSYGYFSWVSRCPYGSKGGFTIVSCGP